VPKRNEVIIKERNLYARLLLHMIFIKDLVFPFDKSPENGSLSPFPALLKSKVKDIVGIHESTFWRDIYSKIHPHDDILTYSELENQLETTKIQMEQQLCVAKATITELSSRVVALESTCSKICDMISESKETSRNATPHKHYAEWMVTTMTHYERYKNLFEGALKSGASARRGRAVCCPSCGFNQSGQWSDLDAVSLSTIGPCEEGGVLDMPEGDLDFCEGALPTSPVTKQKKSASGERNLESHQEESKLQDLISKQKDVYIDELLGQLQAMDNGYNSIISGLQSDMSDQKLHYHSCVEMLQEKVRYLDEELGAASTARDSLAAENSSLRESLADIQKKHSSQSIYCEALLSSVASLRQKAEQQASRADAAGTLENILVHSIEYLATSSPENGGGGSGHGHRYENEVDDGDQRHRNYGSSRQWQSPENGGGGSGHGHLYENEVDDGDQRHRNYGSSRQWQSPAIPRRIG
jgi:hypothetical protein